MAHLPSGQFDPSQHQDMRDFSPVPPGEYIAKITNSEMKDTSTGGEMLVLNFEIAAGEYMGKGFVTRLNLINKNPTTVKIANEELATIIRACALGAITDSEQLHGIAMVAKLKLVPANNNYAPKNEATNYSSAAGLTAPPLNPAPDAATKAIMAGTATKSAPAASPSSNGSVPAAPAGFGGPAEVPAPPVPAAPPAPAVVPPPPPAPAVPSAPAAAAGTGDGPPW